MVLDENHWNTAALQEMLGSDYDQMVLVPRDEWEHIRGSQSEDGSTAPPTLLLPFSWKKLVAHLYELVRGSNSSNAGQVVRFGDVCVDLSKMEVKRSSGELVALTPQEFKTLKCFLLSPDRAFSRDELLNQAWGYENYPSTRTVDNHILKLRQKLEKNPARPVHFRTIHGVGYRFVP